MSFAFRNPYSCIHNTDQAGARHPFNPAADGKALAVNAGSGFQEDQAGVKML